jgi:hypothetical protein
MNLDPVRFREALSKIPIGFWAPVFYSVFILSILLYVVLYPVVYVYGLLLCCEVWIEWTKRRKDVLIIHLSSDYSREWMSRLSPFIAERATFLDWSNRKNWDPWSLEAQLFRIFGPHGMPEQFTANSLPAAIVFRKLLIPKAFTFGERSKTREQKLEQLHALLNLG